MKKYMSINIVGPPILILLFLIFPSSPTRFLDSHIFFTSYPYPRENGICQNWNLSESIFCHFLKKLEFVRIGICQNWNLSELEFVRIGIGQNWNLSESEFVRIGICQNWNLSELEFVRIGICQNRNLSELEFVSGQ